MPAVRGAERRYEDAGERKLQRDWSRAVLRTYGDVCHLCGHGGARQADHIIPETERPDLKYVVSNGRPAHGAPRNRCPVCKQNCNQLRGYGSVERGRRKVSDRAQQGARVKPAVTIPDAGREW